MTAESERLILYRLNENAKAIGCMDKKLDTLTVAVEHRVTALEVEAKVSARRTGGKAGAISGGVIALLTAIATCIAVLAKGLFS